MTPRARSPRVPGRVLLRVAPYIFDASVVSAVVMPTIADLQQEVRAAGGRRVRRWRARWRGYRAFWWLVVTAPFAFRSWPCGAELVSTRSAIVDGAFTLMVVVLMVSVWRFTGWWTVGALVGGGLAAIAIRWWHDQHPSELAMPLRGTSGAPDINISRIPVAGDAGGLIYVVGSVVIGVLGLPMLRWFFVAAFLGGFLGAVLLRAWRQVHGFRTLEHPIGWR